jgi:heme exporter protein A
VLIRGSLLFVLIRDNPRNPRLNEFKTVSMIDSALQLDSVSRAFDTRKVLKGIDLTVPKGQSLYVCGVNGAGKSTLLNIIAGLIAPDDGTVSVCGNYIAKHPQKTKSLIGFISHKPMLYNELTVTENLHFFADLYGIEKPADRINQLLQDLGLSSYRHDSVGILSRGWLQRLSIARALLHQPDILLADEPFTGLDTEANTHFISIIKDFITSSRTVIMTTHDISVGLSCCDRVVVLDKCSIVFDALTADIDADAFAKDYLAYAKGSK